MTSNSNIDNNDMEFTLDFDDLDLSFDSEISDDSENTASDEDRGGSNYVDNDNKEDSKDNKVSVPTDKSDYVPFSQRVKSQRPADNKEFKNPTDSDLRRPNSVSRPTTPSVDKNPLNKPVAGENAVFESGSTASADKVDNVNTADNSTIKKTVIGDHEVSVEESEAPVGTVSVAKVKIAPKKGNNPLFDTSKIGKKEDSIDFEKAYVFKNAIKGSDEVTKYLEERQRELRAKFGNSNMLEASKLIDVEVAMQAPLNYFDKYSDDVKAGINYCRPKIRDSGNSEVVSDAINNPTIKENQEAAYVVVARYINEYLARSMFRGIERDVVLNLIINELLGFDVLDPLWNDPRITEIICNGAHDIQVEIDGEMQRVPSLSFRDREHLETLLERLFGSVGKILSQTTPQTKGRLHDKSRIFATHHSISPDGPNFNIRRHPHGFWTPQGLIDRGAASEEIMTDLGNLIHKGASFFVAGATSSGKMLSHDTLIQTPNGMITMGDISPGDSVFDHYGNICTVTDKFPNPPMQVYAVKLSTGNIIHAGADHNWLVSTFQSRVSNLHKVNSRNKKDGYQRKAKIAPEKIEKIEKIIASKDYPNLMNANDLGILVDFSVSQKPKLLEKLKAATDTPDKRKKFYHTEKALHIILSYSKEILNDQRHKKPDLWQVKTTAEMIEEGVYLPTKNGKVGRYNFRVPKLEKAVEFNNAKGVDELPIHPYLFGLWLGDGNSNGNRFTGMVEDVEFYESVLPGNFHWYGRDNKSHKIITPNFKDTLRENNLLQTEKGVSKKHIPADYLYATEEARRELIAGLLDSDGCHMSNSAGWEFYNTNKDLVDGFIQLTSSLGYRANISKEKYKDYVYKEEQLQSKKTSWTVTVLTEDSLAKLPRKIEAHRKIAEANPLSDDDLNNVSITSIEEVAGRVEEMSCISVDSPDNTYMVSNHFTTTHNTSMLNALTGFYPSHARILTLEDNLEMKPNPKKFLAAAQETRPPSPNKLNDRGVTMRDLVWGAMQMRPEVLIIGEVTDAAAYDLCQALNTGHAGASTFHANSSQLAITRVSSLVAQSGLTTIEGAFDLISAAFDFVINVRHFPQDGSRRIFSIDEVGSEPIEVNGKLMLPVFPMWRFNEEGIDDDGNIVGMWTKVGEISKERAERRMFDYQRTLSWEELKALSALPEGQVAV